MSSIDYTKITLKELKEKAKEQKIAGYSKMNKNELIDALTLNKNAHSSLEQQLILEVENTKKLLTIAQENFRIAQDNLTKFKSKVPNVKPNNDKPNNIKANTATFRIVIDYNHKKYDRLVNNIEEIKQILVESFISQHDGNVNDYSFKHIKTWMGKAKVSDKNFKISIDENDFIISDNGYDFGAFIQRIS